MELDVSRPKDLVAARVVEGQGLNWGEGWGYGGSHRLPITCSFKQEGQRERTGAEL